MIKVRSGGPTKSYDPVSVLVSLTSGKNFTVLFKIHTYVNDGKKCVCVS